MRHIRALTLTLPYLALVMLPIYTDYAPQSLRWFVLQRNLGPSSCANFPKMILVGFGDIFPLGRVGERVRSLSSPAIDFLYVFLRTNSGLASTVF